MRKAISVFILFLVFTMVNAQNVTGVWKTIDDETQIVKSQVEIYEKDGMLYGKIIKILDPSAPDNGLCDTCKGKFKNKSLIGVEIIKNMHKKGKYYKNGTITDPEADKTYDCKIWLSEDDPDILMVRGYIAFLYRTQTWYRVK